jgi:hypothetical protein
MLFTKPKSQSPRCITSSVLSSTSIWKGPLLLGSDFSIFLVTSTWLSTVGRLPAKYHTSSLELQNYGSPSLEKVLFVYPTIRLQYPWSPHYSTWKCSPKMKYDYCLFQPTVIGVVVIELCINLLQKQLFMSIYTNMQILKKRHHVCDIHSCVFHFSSWMIDDENIKTLLDER